MELLIGAHDPEGRMVRQLHYLQPTLQLFESIIVATSPSSVAELGETLQRMGASVFDGSQNPHETELVLMKQSKSTVTFTALDKLLHMQRYFPEEVEGISRSNPFGFVLFGRTDRAFSTYPDSWRVNESIANREMVLLTGIPNIDIGVGNFEADRKTIELLSMKPALPNWECLVEMPADVILAGFSFKYVSLDGLEWEDPDRYEKEIQEEGFENWKMRLYDSPQEWDKRRAELDGYLKAQARFRTRLGLPISKSSSL